MKKYRDDFPIFSKISSLIYLDSASTSQKPQCVIDSVSNFYTTYNSNIHRGLYKIAEMATLEVEKARIKISTFINASSPDEIIFTHGTTEGINIIMNGLKKFISEGSAILLTEMEHNSNLVPWQKIAKEKKAKLYYWAIDKNGQLCDEIKDEYNNIVFTSLLDIPLLSIVALCHVSNVLGTIVDIKKIASLLTEKYGDKNKPFIIVDAAQSAPHFSINVQDMGCDFLVFSGHKMMSPTGIGILFGKKKILKEIDPLIYGSQMIREVSKNLTTFTESPQKFESGTLPIEAIIGLSSAIDYLNRIGIKNVRMHEIELTEYAMIKMNKIEGLTIYGPLKSNDRSGAISFSLENIHPHDIAQILGDMNICIRAGHHCAQILHSVLGIQASARVSFYIYNDRDDVDLFISGIKKVKSIFKK